MRSMWKFLIAAVVIGVALAAVVWQQRTGSQPSGADDVRASSGTMDESRASYGPLPCLVEFSAGDCGPCKTMEPILDELTGEYEGRLRIETIDIWKQPTAGEEHNIHMYPTQIFYDAMGNELFRHEGFFAKEDILAQWKELGHDFEQP